MSLSKPRPILKDMPYHIKKMIVESIPPFLDRLPLRKTSKEFMRIVDTAKFEMKLTIDDKTIEIKSGAGNALRKEHPTTTEAIDHFKRFISKQNVTFFAMSISGDRAHSMEFLEMLTATVHRPLRVKSIGMMGGGQARILEFMEPGTLKHVALLSMNQAEVDSIFRMKQWKQAKSVVLMDISAACEAWWDFTRFYIHNNPLINLTDLSKILEHLINSDTFVEGVIHTFCTIEMIVEALGGGDWKSKQDEDEDRFAEKAFPVGNHGSRIIVQAFHRRVEFIMNRTEQ